MPPYKSLEWRGAALRLLDQRQLPQRTVYLECTDHHQVAEAIAAMVVRGAPAIGAAAAYGMALAAQRSTAQDVPQFILELEQAAQVLNAARPTAVNLSWAVRRVLQRVREAPQQPLATLHQLVLDEAHAIAQEDVRANRQIGLNGLPLIPNPAKILHHCNTGALATVDYGTALGVIRTAHEHGKRLHVYLDETRPRLQGARLSAWELQQLGIPYTVIVDGAAGFLMRRVGIDLCLVGADRIAANGDTANKIGTYTLAILAREHGVPFYVVAPTSTIDFALTDGEAIPIEQRSPEEVMCIGAERIAPEGSEALNFAFDVTPARYVTAIITEAGIAYPPFERSLAALARSL